MGELSSSGGADEEQQDGDWARAVDDFLAAPPLVASVHVGGGAESPPLQRPRELHLRDENCVRVPESSIATADASSSSSLVPSVVFEPLVDFMTAFAEPRQRDSLRIALRLLVERVARAHRDGVQLNVITNRLLDALNTSNFLKLGDSQYADAQLFDDVVAGFAASNANPNLMQRSAPPSRFATDFHQRPVMIGSGAFGTVFKAHCKLDGQQYAVKRIRLEGALADRTEWNRVGGEVKMLAKLRHENVVRYHTGWIELEHSPEEQSIREGMPDLVASSSPVLVTPPVGVVIQEQTSSQDDGTWQSADRSESRQNPMPVGGKFWRGSSESTAPAQSTHATQELAMVQQASAGGGEQRPQSFTFNMVPVVYIQMELCARTLEQVIRDRRNTKVDETSDDAFFWSVAKQLLAAVAYIHEKGLIHRDIKPGNVFLSDEKTADGLPRVLLGDFGLACMENKSGSEDETIPALEEGEQPDSRDSRDSRLLTVAKVNQHSPLVEHSKRVGTRGYAAPEQLNSKSYGTSVDVYSTGVVLHELLGRFQTTAERSRALDELKQTPIKELGQKSPLALVRRMLAQSPQERPTAAELLAEIMKSEKMVLELEAEIAHRERKHRAEMEELKKELERLQAQRGTRV